MLNCGLMKRLALLVPVVVSAMAVGQTVETFDGSLSLPPGWQSGVTGKGTAKWGVVEAKDAVSGTHVLRQAGEGTFCWAAKTDAPFRDGFVEVKFKPVSGKEDQAGGLVFRFQDANNYYLVRGNALEDNVVLYKTVNGRRSSLPVKGRTFGYGVDTKVPAGKWNTLRVEFVGALFAVFFNGEKLFEVEDKTFAKVGGVGVWTKADSVTLFDDFTYQAR